MEEEIKNNDELSKQSSTINKKDQYINLTKKQLLASFINNLYVDKFLANLQKKKLLKNKEKYEWLKPVWFEYAPESARQYREALEQANDLKQMEHLKNKLWISYNVDWTMNILLLNKTFCEDISWQNKRFNFVQAKKIEKNNVEWYKLMTDYNDNDTEEEIKQSDRYKFMNAFNYHWKNKWDTPQSWSIFRQLTWCNDRYLTNTFCKDEHWIIMPNVIRLRTLHESSHNRIWSNLSFNDVSWKNLFCNIRVCGIKDYFG